MRRTLVLSILLCMSATIYADYKDAFRKAIQARNRGRWPEVVRYLKEAIAEEPKETGERINISGMDFVPYLPQFYLGLALLNTGDCPGALQAFQQSEAQGAVRKMPEGGNLAGLRRKCEGLVAANPPPVNPPPVKPPVIEKPAETPKADPAVIVAAQTAANVIDRAEDAARSATQWQNDALVSKVWGNEPALGPAAQRAQATLSQARSELEAGRRDNNVQRLNQAATLAASAQMAFETVRQTGQARRDQLQNANVASKIAPVKIDPPKPPENTPNPTTSKPFTPPPALAAAARLVFSARYQEATAALDKLRYDAGPAAAQTAMLKAAAHYSMYLLSGERDAALLEQARQSVVECRRLAPAMQPDAQAFSPRFVEFYSKTRN